MRDRDKLASVPSLDREWSHWAIYGDHELLDIVPEVEEVRARRLVERNRDLFEQVWVHRARQVGPEDEFEIQEGRSGMKPMSERHRRLMP